MNKTLFIHIGVGRTGCTNFAYSSSNNESLISTFKLRYMPDGPEMVSHIQSDDYDTNKFLDNFIYQINNDKKHTNFIISSENLPSLDTKYLQRISEVLDGNVKVKILVFLRRQDELINSWYSEIIKSNANKTLNGLIDELKANGSLLNYENLLKPWVSVFGEKNIIAMTYNSNQNTFITIMNYLNVKIEDSQLEDIGQGKKEGLGPEQILLIKHCKDLLDENHLKQLQIKIDKSKTKYKSILSPELREKILEEYSESNDNIAKKYFKRRRLFNSYKKRDEEDWEKLDIFENGYFDAILAEFKNTNTELYDILKKCEFNKNRPKEYLVGLPLDNMDYLYLKKRNSKQEFDKKIALLISIFYTDMTEFIADYVNRIPYECDIYLSCNNSDDYEKFKKLINEFHTVYDVEYPIGGMDLHPFFRQLDFLIKSNKKYDYYLKAHSKRDFEWASGMYESNLPYTEYQKIFDILDKTGMCGSGKYLYKYSCSHQNKSLILEKIKQFNVDLDESDIYDTLSDFDPIKEELDLEFYNEYHEDIKTLLLPEKNTNKLNEEYLKEHWETCGKKEMGRIPNSKIVKSQANRNYLFNAGTFFWFSHQYLEYFLKNMDDFPIIFENLEKESGEIKNLKTTYTHHLEYWFGLVGSHLAYPKQLNGVKTITFLIPPLVEDDARSGGFRTLLRMIGYMQKKNYFVNIEICGDYETTEEQQKQRIDVYNEIPRINDITLYFEENASYADVYIATGWQTHKKVNFYKSKNRLVGFFCQDLEYEFGAVKLCETRVKNCKDFYNTKIPTFTMSKFLKSKFTDDRKIYSVSLNVDPTTFKIDKSISKNGVCLLYAPVKSHRLPELVLKLTTELATKHPSKNIYLYGDDTMMDLDIKNDNIKLLGTLTAEETADLYKKCELGVIFSTTNPSRIAFEMVACGTPAIEADCEYTKYDMNNDAFVRMNTEFDDIMNKINELFNDPSEMKRLVNECENYSQTHFYANAEEKHFYEFIEEGILEKQINRSELEQTEETETKLTEETETKLTKETETKLTKETETELTEEVVGISREVKYEFKFERQPSRKKGMILVKKFKTLKLK